MESFLDDKQHTELESASFHSEPSVFCLFLFFTVTHTCVCSHTHAHVHTQVHTQFTCEYRYICDVSVLLLFTLSIHKAEKRRP